MKVEKHMSSSDSHILFKLSKYCKVVLKTFREYSETFNEYSIAVYTHELYLAICAVQLVTLRKFQCYTLIMPPTFKTLVGHIGLPLFVRPSVRSSVRASVRHAF